MFALTAIAEPQHTQPHSMLVFIACSLQAALKYVDTDISIHYASWEDEVIRKYYKTAGAAFCQSLLPHRSIYSIRHQAEKIGVKYRDCIHWSSIELTIVKQGILANKCVKAIWHDLGAAGFNRSFYAVKDKAGDIRKEL